MTKLATGWFKVIKMDIFTLDNKWFAFSYEWKYGILSIFRQFLIHSLVNLRLSSQMKRFYTIGKWQVDLFGWSFCFWYNKQPKSFPLYLTTTVSFPSYITAIFSAISFCSSNPFSCFSINKLILKKALFSLSKSFFTISFFCK